jgi:RNA polymerase sigma-70 factor, ECF subfamily
MDLQTDELSVTTPSDEEVVHAVKNGRIAQFEILMRRYNQRLFRTARAIVKSDAEAEDVLQDAYVSAYTHLGSFEGRAPFRTWLTRIVVNEACGRLRREKRYEPMTDDWDPSSEGEVSTPEGNVSDREIAALVENALDTIPEAFRSVFMLRAIEGLSVAETAACLDIPEETVKTRLFRARARLRTLLEARTDAALPTVHRFLGNRCDRTVAAVLERISQRADS